MNDWILHVYQRSDIASDSFNDFRFDIGMSKAICPLCNKPCGPLQLGAKVYHWFCLKTKFKALRAKWAKEQEDAQNTDKFASLDYWILQSEAV